MTTAGLLLLSALAPATPSPDAPRQTDAAQSSHRQDAAFPTIWGLSKRRYSASAGMFVVQEQFVVAFADGTYSTDLSALHGRADAPGEGDRLGEWRIEGDRLLTRFDDPDGEFRPQYFPSFRTRPGATGLRLSGCYTGTAIRLAFEFRTICFDPDGSYRRESGSRASGRSEASTGTYAIDSHRLTLREGSTEVQTGFAILTGEASAPASIVVDRERFSAD